ncbi:conserved hypothetical protein [Lebetimonas natsushimae]|uniref:Uncharacterized protein n=1 Tax=Lebetimonas natsushimae TaxID=1936991 RepID=A0A292YB21_9BACT|nr:hypothetical protein [Lebetimonas natsushimae]GAX88162.1 conserved hypothetical protein [Lebetimonas natsushimae]
MNFFNTFDFIENFFPNTPLAFLIFLLSFFLLTTIFVLITAKLIKKDKKLKKNNQKKQLSIENLIEIARNKKSNINDLVFAFKYFNENFKVKQFPDKAFDFFKLILTHKNRGKVLFDIFHNKTVKLNKDFEDQLNKIEKECLNR